MTRSFYCIITSLLFFACSRKGQSSNEEKPIVPNSIQAILIDEGNFQTPCEPTICINPTDVDNIVAGAVLDWVYTSEDGGLSWTKSHMQSTYGVFGDPVIRADFNGNLYYSHLSNPTGGAYQDTAFLDRIVIQKSLDKGKTWNNGSFTLPRSPKDQDKQWMAVNPNDNSLYLSWTEFDLYGSDDPVHKSRILFSKSVDSGESWSYPLVLSQLEGDCLDGDMTTEGAVPCVGGQGEIYVAWSFDEKIFFDRSFDGGKTWEENDILVTDQPGGWGFDVPGILRCNGMPITDVDRSNGAFNGRVYVNWSDQRNGSDDTDIWLSYSDDKGTSWTQPIRVNNDTTKTHQFFTWMTIDQSTGYIYMVFYDRREHLDSTTDVYLAYSKDGGNSFKNVKINEESFVPTSMIFFGDYNDISAYNGRVRPIWTQLDKFKLSVWTAIIN